MSEYIVEFGSPINEDNEYIHEPIVRCKDCKFINLNEYGLGCDTHCMALADENGFCAWAVKR